MKKIYQTMKTMKMSHVFLSKILWLLTFLDAEDFMTKQKIFHWLVAIMMLIPLSGLANECPNIQYDAANYEAGDRIVELGDNPKVAVGQDNDTRYFTGKHINLNLPNAPTTITQLEVIANFGYRKETIFQLFSGAEDQAKPVLQFNQDDDYLWVTDGGKKKSRSRYLENHKPDSYRFIFKKDTIRTFVNQEYIGSVEGRNQLSRVAITGLKDSDKLFNIGISPVCHY